MPYKGEEHKRRGAHERINGRAYFSVFARENRLQRGAENSAFWDGADDEGLAGGGRLCGRDGKGRAGNREASSVGGAQAGRRDDQRCDRDRTEGIHVAYASWRGG